MSYSIIIPHYNLPALLDRCLKSIPRRDDIQVVVVDDMSSEENRRKLIEMQETFPYAQFVFCEKNGGGGAARNRGLDEAKGDYILFSDADDYFCKGFELLLDKYSAQDNDIVYFNANFVNTDTGEPAKIPNHVAESAYTKKLQKRAKNFYATILESLGARWFDAQSSKKIKSASKKPRFTTTRNTPTLSVSMQKNWPFATTPFTITPSAKEAFQGSFPTTGS